MNIFCGMKATYFDGYLLNYENAKANILETDSFLNQQKEIKHLYSYSVFEKQYNLKKLPFTQVASFFDNEEKRKFIKVYKTKKEAYKPMGKGPREPKMED